MSELVIDLAPELAQQLAEVAGEAGVTSVDYAREAVAEKIAAAQTTAAQEVDEGGVDSLIALLDQWDTEDAARNGDPGLLPSFPRFAVREAPHG